MSDVLIRDVPDDVLAAVESHAAKLGLSRNEYLRRQLAQNATPRIEARAVEVQESLAGLGHHRAPSVPDPIIASDRELAGLVVLHVDKDFELIAGVTQQPTERLRLA